MKLKSKILMLVSFLVLINFGLLLYTTKAFENQELFYNFLFYNTNINTNYGILQENTSNSNEYRMLFDTSVKAQDFNSFENMIEISNTDNYTNYIYQQNRLEFTDDSFKNTNGYYNATISFNNDYDLSYFNISSNPDTSVYISEHYNGHSGVAKIQDNSATYSAYIVKTYDFDYSGYISFYICFENLASGFHFYLRTGGGSVLFDLHTYANTLSIQTPLYSHYGLKSIQENIWYYIEVYYETDTTGFYGLKENTYNIIIDGLDCGIHDFLSSNHIEQVYFYSEGALDDFSCYIDGFTMSSIIASGIYNSTYNFLNDTVGSNPNDWIVDEGGGDVKVLNTHKEHTNVVGLIDASVIDDCYFRKLDLNATSGTFEYWFFTWHPSSYNYLIGYNGSGYTCFYLVVQGSMFKYHDGTSWNDIQACSAGQWYHISIDFELDNGGYKGLSDDTWNLRIDGVEYSDLLCSNPSQYFYEQRFFTYTTQTCYFFIDAVGFSWISDYTENDNYDTYDLDNGYKINLLSKYQQSNNLITAVEIKDAYTNNFGGWMRYLYESRMMIIDNNFYIYYGSIYTEFIVLDNNYDYIETIDNPLPDIYAGCFYYNGVIYLCNTAGGIATMYRYTKDFVFIDSFVIDCPLSVAGLNTGFVIQDGIIYFVWTYTTESYIMLFDLNGDLIDVSNELYYTGANIWRVLKHDNYIYTMNLDGVLSVFDDNTYEFLGNFGNDFSPYHYQCLTINNDILYSFTNEADYVEIKTYLLNMNYISNGFQSTFYLYNETNSLKGKIEISMPMICYNDTNKFAVIQLKEYLYEGSFEQNYLNSETYSFEIIDNIEINYHIQIGYRDLYKGLYINIECYSNETNVYNFTKSIPYQLQYSYDKIKYNMFNYSQTNNYQYCGTNNTIIGINSNFYKNNIKGIRIIACFDLNQRFQDFYSFGSFYESISVMNVDYPTPDLDQPTDYYWLYAVSELALSNNETIYTTHLNFTYPLFVQNITLHQYYYQVWQYTAFIPYIEGNWSLLDWVRIFLNGVIWLLNFFAELIFEFFVNLFYVGTQFFLYLLNLAWHTLIMGIVVSGLLLLFWNFALKYIIFFGLLFLEGLYFLFYVLLPIFFSWFFHSLLPVILDYLADIFATFLGIVLWITTGGKADLPTIITSIGLFLDTIYDFIYEVIIFIIDNIVVILSYSYAYIDTYIKVYVKYLYVKARGFRKREKDLESTMNAYKTVQNTILNSIKKLPIM